MIKFGIHNHETGRKAIVILSDFTQRLDRKSYKRLGSRDDSVIDVPGVPTFVLGGDLWKLCRHMLALNQHPAEYAHVLVALNPECSLQDRKFRIYNVVWASRFESSEAIRYVYEVAPRLANANLRLTTGPHGNMTTTQYSEAFAFAEVVEIHLDVVRLLGYEPTSNDFFRSPTPTFMVPGSLRMVDGEATMYVPKTTDQQILELYQ